MVAAGRELVLVGRVGFVAWPRRGSGPRWVREICCRRTLAKYLESLRRRSVLSVGKER